MQSLLLEELSRSLLFNNNIFFINVILIIVLMFFNIKINFIYLKYQFFFFFFFFLFKDLNLKLLNGLFSIHPLFNYCAIACFLLINFLYFYNFFFYKKKIVFLGFIFTALGLFLGSWWAFQELNWGGWWNWDLIEFFNLLLFIFYFLNFHKNFIFSKVNNYTFINNLIFFIIFFFSNRYSLLFSLHSFSVSTSKLKFFFSIIFFFFFFYCIVFCVYF